MLGLRAATAAVLLGVFGSVLFFGPDGVWIGFCALALVPSAWEWGRLARLGSGLNTSFVLVSLGSLLALLYTPLQSLAPWLYGAAAVFWIVAAPAWLRRRPSVPA